VSHHKNISNIYCKTLAMRLSVRSFTVTGSTLYRTFPEWCRAACGCNCNMLCFTLAVNL